MHLAWNHAAHLGNVTHGSGMTRMQHADTQTHSHAGSDACRPQDSSSVDGCVASVAA